MTFGLRKIVIPLTSPWGDGYHVAEVCKLIGLFMLSQLAEAIPKSSIGLYRNDGLAATPVRP